MNRAEIRESAMGLLLGQRLHRLPVDPRSLCRGEIRCDSMGSFCSRTRMTAAQLTREANLPDGLTLLLPDKQYLILYNERQVRPRRSFTIAHELGHIRLGHLHDRPREEREANLFAAELLMPRVLIRECERQKKGRCTPSEVAELFGVSRRAAEIRLEGAVAEHSPLSEREYLLLRRYRGLLPTYDS